MAWFRLDDQGAFHEKVIAAGNEAYGAWVRAGQWSSGRGTEGRITKAVALSIAPMRVWKRLIEARGTSSHGLVEEVGHDFQIHDFLDWNPTAEEVIAKREARSAAGKLGGQRSVATRKEKQAASKSEANGKQTLEQTGSKPEANDQAKLNPVPVPVPVPVPEMEDSDHEAGGPPAAGPLVALGTARCEECCQVFVDSLTEAGCKRPPVRDKWDRQAICDAVSTHLDADGTIRSALVALRQAVGDWTEAFRDAPRYTSGWSPKKFLDWLPSRDSGPFAAPTAAPSASRIKLPPLEPDPEPEPMTDEERAYFAKLQADGGRSSLLLEILEDDRNHVVPEIPRIAGVQTPTGRGAA